MKYEENKKDDFRIKHVFIKYFLFLFLCIKNPLKNELTEHLMALVNIKLVYICFKLFFKITLFAFSGVWTLYSYQTHCIIFDRNRHIKKNIMRQVWSWIIQEFSKTKMYPVQI